MTSTIVTTTARPATVTTDTMTIIATRGTETGTDTTRTGQWPQEWNNNSLRENNIILQVSRGQIQRGSLS